MRSDAAASAPPQRDPRDRGARFSAASISHAVWRCYRFAQRHRDIEGLLAERGVRVNDEAIRLRYPKFGPAFATGRRRRRGRAQPLQGGSRQSGERLWASAR